MSKIADIKGVLDKECVLFLFRNDPLRRNRIMEIISNERNEARKMEELTNMDDDDEKLKISMEDVQLNFEDLGSPSVYNDDLVVLDDVELLV